MASLSELIKKKEKLDDTTNDADTSRSLMRKHLVHFTVVELQNTCRELQVKHYGKKVELISTIMNQLYNLKGKENKIPNLKDHGIVYYFNT